MNHPQINEVILTFLRADVDQSWQEDLKGFSESDWETVSRRSIRHRIVTLLYHHLMTFFKEVRVPDGIMTRLRNANLYFTARNIRFYHELDRLLQHLNDCIPVLLLKGAHLAAFVYRDICLRSMVDLDVLVRKADLPKVEKAMGEMGYTKSIKTPLDHPYHVGYVDPTKTMLLEVHWHICSEPIQSVIDVEELWRDARSELLKGKKVVILRPEHFLLHICLHDAGQHFYFCGLRTFCDIDAVIQRYREEIDWEMVVAQAKQWGIVRSTYLTLLLAKELINADVPDEVLTAIKPKDFKTENLVWARKAIFAPLAEDEPVSEHFAHFWGAEQYKSKMALFLANVFPPREVMGKIYSVRPGSPGIYLYYPWRLIELSMRYGRSVRKMGDEGSDLRIGLEAEHSRILLREWLQK